MASSSSVKTIISNAKSEVEKFDGTNNFSMWQCEVRDVLSQQELEIAVEDKPSDMKDDYDHFTHTLINGKTEVKYDVVSAALMNNEYRKKDKQAHKDSSYDALTNKQNGSQYESKASGKSKQVEFDVISVKSDGDYTNEEETPVDVIPVELEGDDTGEEETPAQEPPQEQADSIATSRPKRNIRKP
ncbi:hypothetical protein MRB53_033038 [Persea americana]|uniref:Uncharacterized protein n=1 Tax=Persea americana TaxID=3435 RepID=A0ACC2KU40_PERAE|nr:hypothetical protein MRB53_033038 [Persea americana]